jgi:hypothetical protein
MELVGRGAESACVGEIFGASLHKSVVAVFPSQGSFRKICPGGAKSNFSAADSALLVIVGANVCMQLFKSRALRIFITKSSR